MNKYINACKLIKDLRDNAAEHFNSVVNSIIIAQPSADVRENIHGEWEERFEYQHEKFCSKCGIPQLWMNAVVYNFCPNCGADMRNKEVSNE